MKRIKTINQALVILMCLLCAFMFVLLNSAETTAAKADTETKTSYTGALEDLKKDESFTLLNYPEIANDYALYVVQIAESTDGELFVYVYQPCAANKRLYATSINISTGINENLSYKNYKLVFLNADGVFFKYRVKDFAVKSDKVRYYDISSIYRAWDEDLNDKKLPETNENKIAEVSFAVEKQYTACTVAGEVSYSCLEPEYITITDKYVGYMRYGEDDIPGFLKFYTLGILSLKQRVDSWYVAFSTDMPIDKLMEADVYYVSQTFYVAAMLPIPTPKQEKYAYLKAKKSEPVEAGLFQKNTYSWDLIQSAKDFIATEKLTEEGAKDISNKQWVLRFAATSYINESLFIDGISVQGGYTNISEVTILRLKFETDGKVYNLGVVDNKQSSAEGQAPDNPQEKPKDKDKDNGDGLTGWDKFVNWLKTAWAAIKKFFTGKVPWWIYVAVVGVVLAIGLPILGLIFPPVMAVLKLIFKGLWKGIKYLFKALWWLICLPFRGIAALVRKHKKNKKEKPQKNKIDKQIRF